MHHISLFRQSFIERLLQHHDVPDGEAESAARRPSPPFSHNAIRSLYMPMRSPC